MSATLPPPQMPRRAACLLVIVAAITITGCAQTEAPVAASAARVFSSLTCVEAAREVSGSARGAVPHDFVATEAVWCEPIAPVDGFGLPDRGDAPRAETDFVRHLSATPRSLVDVSRAESAPCADSGQATGRQPHFIPVYVTDAAGSAVIIGWPMTACSTAYSVDRAGIMSEVFDVTLPDGWDGGWSVPEEEDTAS